MNLTLPRRMLILWKHMPCKSELQEASGLVFENGLVVKVLSKEYDS